MRLRVAKETKTTFASSYAQDISLRNASARCEAPMPSKGQEKNFWFACAGIAEEPLSGCFAPAIRS